MHAILDWAKEKGERLSEAAICIDHGRCLACGTPWCVVRGHVTHYGTGGSGLFPLCAYCWEERPPPERLPFYRVLWERQNFTRTRYAATAPPVPWEEVEQAVLAGL